MTVRRLPRRNFTGAKSARVSEWEPPSATAGSPPTAPFAFGGHRYRLIRGALSWQSARETAANLRGHLATITSREENQWIIRTFYRPNTRFWLGGQRDVSGDWKWITGEPWVFTNWARTAEGVQPSGKSASGEPEDCLEMTTNEKKLPPAGWNDRNAKGGSDVAVEGFLIEWDIPMRQMRNRRDPGEKPTRQR